jgi:superfamily I DNA/RNA helicase
MIIEMVQSGVPPGDILVLAQRSAIGTPIYERIMGGGIPAKSYYSEAELDVEDAQRRFALLKLFVDKSDRVALRWLLGLGASNWRSPGYHRIRKRCEETNDSPWDLLIKLTSGVVSLPHVKAIVSKFREIRETLTTLESCPGILGVVDHLFPVDCESTRGLREASIGVLTEMGKEDRSEFLTRLTSKITAPEVPSDVEEVRIMSLHKSKGLSSPITIISGCVEGLLPTRPGADLSPDEAAAYFEEQRRLFYVGITRVKADPEEGKPGTLILSYSRQMPLADAMQSGISPARVTFGTAMLNASRFIHELGASAPRPIIG